MLLADPTGGLAATDPVRGQISLTRETTPPIRPDLLALFEKEVHRRAAEGRATPPASILTLRMAPPSAVGRLRPL